MFQRILIFDDGAEALRLGLLRAGYDARLAQAGERPAPGDLVLGDAGGDRRLIAQWRGAAVVVVYSAATEATTRVEALEAGADDFWTKPLAPVEIAARLRAWQRRGGGLSFERVLQAGDAWIDFARAIVRRGGRQYALSMKEFLLLRYFADHAEQTLTRADLLRHALGFHSTLTRTLDMHISNLRKKVESDPAHPRYVVTVPGQGYKFTLQGK